jgi:hypothetical protein
MEGYYDLQRLDTLKLSIKIIRQMILKINEPTAGSAGKIIRLIRWSAF